ncbi:hypothetical protein OS493_022019 [Desmophyllum pertusum]|uniref:Uncharacterized protein n=1 Tax=Desmophyllum pertusum TaxID=174260 RepID=A0A9X0CQQ3_9CNID|nr:hypothetical protein OS493_022019 [Desmophyllum pertusum]
MGKDKRGIERGQCTICPCEEFDTEGSIFCEYCGHPPINHVVLDNHEQASKKMKISHEHGAEEEDRCEYNATGQRNDDTTVLQSIEIDPVSTAMPNNGDSEKQDHNEIFEIDAIPSSTPNDGDSEKQDHAEIVELKKSDSTQADLPNPDGLQKLQKLVDEIVKTQLHQNTSVKLSVSRKNDSVFAHCNLCQGFYLNKYEYNVNNETVSVDPKLLINDVKPGEDEGKISWYPEPHFSFVKTRICEESEELIKEVHSIYRWRNQHKVELEGGIQASNFKKLSDIYSEAMKKLGLSSIPVLAAEDETAIIAHVTYNEAEDELLGFCGVNGDNHQCLDHFTVNVGDGEEGQWQEVQRLYERDLEPVIGPLIGNSSDGDSRRRKIMLQLAGSDAEGNRFRPIPAHLGFVFSCRKEETEDGSYIIRDLCDQDYIHNHKKMMNPLDHATRVLILGDYMVHMNHIKRCVRCFSSNRAWPWG